MLKSFTTAGQQWQYRQSRTTGRMAQINDRDASCASFLQAQDKAAAKASARISGWYAGSGAESCHETCRKFDPPLQCSDAQLKAHNSEVDSSDEPKALIAAMGFTNYGSGECVNSEGKNTDYKTPSWGKRADGREFCSYSSSFKNVSQYSCYGTTQREDQNQLCYCESPKDSFDAALADGWVLLVSARINDAHMCSYGTNSAKGRLRDARTKDYRIIQTVDELDAAGLYQIRLQAPGLDLDQEFDSSGFTGSCSSGCVCEKNLLGGIKYWSCGGDCSSDSQYAGLLNEDGTPAVSMTLEQGKSDRYFIWGRFADPDRRDPVPVEQCKVSDSFCMAAYMHDGIDRTSRDTEEECHHYCMNNGAPVAHYDTNTKLCDCRHSGCWGNLVPTSNAWVPPPAPAPPQASVDLYTLSASGCACYWDKTRNDCACCQNGGCQCSAAHKGQCVLCGQGGDCGQAAPTLAPTASTVSTVSTVVLRTDGECGNPSAKVEPTPAPEPTAPTSGVNAKP
jgi:hypothetical protein